MWDPYAEFEKVTLNNGLEVYAMQWPNASWQRVGFVIGAGTSFDPQGQEGISHFVEHMVSANAKMSHDEIDEFFGDLGGEVNLGATGDLSTYYDFKVPPERAPIVQALDLFGYMLLNARMKRGLDTERGAILSEFAGYYASTPQFENSLAPRKALYPGRWMERASLSIGRREVIEGLQMSDIQAHYDTHYHPRNIRVVGVGACTVEELAEMLSMSSFGREYGRFPRKPLPAIENILPPAQTHTKVSMSEDLGVEASAGRYVSEAAVPNSFSPGLLEIYEHLLHQRLFFELRTKRGWAYDLHIHPRNYGVVQGFLIHCDGIPFEVLDQVDEVVQESIDTLADNEDQFKKIKRHGIAYQELKEFSSLEVLNEAIHKLTYHERLVTQAEWIRMFEGASLSDIKSLTRYLSNEYRFRMIHAQ